MRGRLRAQTAERRRAAPHQSVAFRLPPSAFRLPPSAFRLPPSAFRVPLMPENPIYHSTQRTYGSYLKVTELLDLQTPVYLDPGTSRGHRDELLFIIMHQVYELWFKQMLHELDGVADYLNRDE